MTLDHDISALDAALSQGRVRFCFLKVSGELRDAEGTRCPDLIPADGHHRARRRPSDQVLTFWDLRKGAWRCLRRERLVAIIRE